MIKVLIIEDEAEIISFLKPELIYNVMQLWSAELFFNLFDNYFIHAKVS